MPAGAMGLCALALLQRFADWQDQVMTLTPSDLFHPNGAAWDDIARIADDARRLLAGLQVPPRA